MQSSQCVMQILWSISKKTAFKLHIYCIRTFALLSGDHDLNALYCCAIQGLCGEDSRPRDRAFVPAPRPISKGNHNILSLAAGQEPPPHCVEGFVLQDSSLHP